MNIGQDGIHGTFQKSKTQLTKENTNTLDLPKMRLSVPLGPQGNYSEARNTSDSLNKKKIDCFGIGLVKVKT